jgi:biopolymer transport protein ExbB/TolQ
MIDITELVVRLSRTGAGSVVMWAMVVLSVASIAVIIERWVFFWKHEGNVQEMASDLHRFFLSGSYDEARKMLKSDQGYQSEVLSAALEGAELGTHAVQQLAASAAKVQRLRFERGLAFLGTLGNNAPFIGLFGTVLEIIAALYELGTQSSANASAGAVMATLSAALAATAVGLLVALPAVAFYNYFNRRLKAFQTGADALTHVLLAHMKPDDRTS